VRFLKSVKKILKNMVRDLEIFHGAIYNVDYREMLIIYNAFK